jgi:DNA end-binding protein Ku
MRASACATISFGLISVPTKIYNTASAEKVEFKWFTEAGNNVKQKLLDAVTEEEITNRGTLRNGYEVEKDKYVVFTNEELKALDGDKANLIEIVSFVKDFNINPLEVEKSYYMAPDKNGDKAYKLITNTLQTTKMVAVGKWYCRGRDHLITIIAVNNMLMMCQMYYASEIRALELKFKKDTDPSPKEMELAKLLMEQLSTDRIDMKSFKDSYLERIKSGIDKKLAGEIIPPVKQEVEKVGFDDLAALLELSLHASSKQTG